MCPSPKEPFGSAQDDGPSTRSSRSGGTPSLRVTCDSKLFVLCTFSPLSHPENKLVNVTKGEIMKVRSEVSELSDARENAVAVFIFQDKKGLAQQIAALGKQLGEKLQAAISLKDFTAKESELLFLYLSLIHISEPT